MSDTLITTIRNEKEPSRNRQLGFWVVAALALIAIALLLIYTEGRLRTSSATPDAVMGEGTQSALVSLAGQSAGNVVVVGTIDVAAPGVWAVVHELLPGGELGNALGAARVREPATATTVELLRSTEPGTEYALVLYRSNDEAEFTLSGTSVYVDFETGKRVETRFTTLP